jgi:hypothetical protein
MVTLRPGVSIAPKKFVRVVEVDGPRPELALVKALDDMDSQETHMWQSKYIEIAIEQVS